MTNTTVTPFEDRVKKAAKILNSTTKKLTKILLDNGVDDINMLDATTTSFNDVFGIINEIDGNLPLLKVKAAAGILKGDDPFNKVIELPKKESESTALKALLKASEPIAGWKDEEVLRGYIETDRDDLEYELQKRAKGKRFIVLTDDKKEIDVEASLKMLKRARKEDIPSSIVTEDDKYIHIYKVENYHVDNRVREESPLRPGVTLFDGYCPVTKINFAKVSDSARKMLRLINTFEGKQSRTEERRWVDVAKEKGIDGLGVIFPEVHEHYLELSRADKLPSLKMIAPLETPKADPFRSKTDTGYPIYTQNKKEY